MQKVVGYAPGPGTLNFYLFYSCGLLVNEQADFVKVEFISQDPGPGFLLTLIVASGPVNSISSRPFPKPNPCVLFGEKSEGRV